jgi:hypothetical protein
LESISIIKEKCWCFQLLVLLSEVTMASHVIEHARTFGKVGTNDIFSLMEVIKGGNIEND